MGQRAAFGGVGAQLMQDEAEPEALTGRERHGFTLDLDHFRIINPVGIKRLVGAYAVGRGINPKTAHSQCIGGMVGGIGMALLEETLDPHLGG